MHVCAQGLENIQQLKLYMNILILYLLLLLMKHYNMKTISPFLATISHY